MRGCVNELGIVDLHSETQQAREHLHTRGNTQQAQQHLPDAKQHVAEPCAIGQSHVSLQMQCDTMQHNKSGA